MNQREKTQLIEPYKKKMEASKFTNLLVPSLFPHKIIPFPPLPLSLSVAFKSKSSMSSDSTQVYSGGSIMCCDETTDSDLREGHRRFLVDCNDQVVGKLYVSIKELDIKGVEEDEVYEGLICSMEQRDKEEKIKRVSKIKGFQ